MSTCPPLDVPMGSDHHCENCGWTGKDHELDDICDLWQRLSAGATVPSGQCPECQAFTYIDEPKKKRHVHVLLVDHRHGSNVSVHATHELARASLYAYVLQCWPDYFYGDDGEPMPDDEDKAIDMYFEQAGAGIGEVEWYLLEEREVETR